MIVNAARTSACATGMAPQPGPWGVLNLNGAIRPEWRRLRFIWLVCNVVSGWPLIRLAHSQADHRQVSALTLLRLRMAEPVGRRAAAAPKAIQDAPAIAAFELQ